MDTLDRIERRRLQNRNAQRRFRWKKGSQDSSSNAAVDERSACDERSPIQSRARVANQPAEMNRGAVASQAQFTSGSKRLRLADETATVLTYQNHHSPSLTSSSSSGTPLITTPNSDMTAQRCSGEASMACLSQDDRHMVASSMPFMSTLFLPDYPSPSGLGGLYDPALFAEASIAEANEPIPRARCHGSSSTHLNNGSSISAYSADYELASSGNWGNERVPPKPSKHPPMPSSIGTKRVDDGNDDNENENDNDNSPASPESDKGASSDDEPFQTSLHIAAEHGHESIVGIILASGVMVDERDSEGNTALHLATQTQNLPVVLRLLEQGANPNAMNMRGWTPVHLGISTGSVDIVKALVRHGGDLSRKAKCKK
ncbi:hypothetical protein F5X98DRAFT_330249 [Xylaria grammica]|nr:hypothetical protein F5X98DRAFT_330249 [Xylaria grammica]